MTRQNATGRTPVTGKAKQEVAVKKVTTTKVVATVKKPVAAVKPAVATVLPAAKPRLPRPPVPALKPAASITKPKTPPRPAPATDAEVEPWTGPPRSMAERLERIKAMAERINQYVKFMCDVGSLSSTSNDAKEKAVCAFHDRMVIVETQLARIHEELWLG
ncbi:MAG: hypothetical protein U0736_24795 [Gemmataceae bacterium]